MTLNDHIGRAQTWCRKHWIPYIHGCVWDRECRSIPCPKRITLIWGQYMAYIDLPGYYTSLDINNVDDQGHITRRRTWHSMHIRAHHNRNNNQ